MTTDIALADFTNYVSHKREDNTVDAERKTVRLLAKKRAEIERQYSAYEAKLKLRTKVCPNCGDQFIGRRDDQVVCARKKKCVAWHVRTSVSNHWYRNHPRVTDEEK